MKAIKLVAISLLIITVLLVGVGFMLPTAWNTEARTVISAKPEVIFPQLNTLSEWYRVTCSEYASHLFVRAVSVLDFIPLGQVSNIQ